MKTFLVDDIEICDLGDDFPADTLNIDTIPSRRWPSVFIQHHTRAGKPPCSYEKMGGIPMEYWPTKAQILRCHTDRALLSCIDDDPTTEYATPAWIENLSRLTMQADPEYGRQVAENMLFMIMIQLRAWWNRNAPDSPEIGTGMATALMILIGLSIVTDDEEVIECYEQVIDAARVHGILIWYSESYPCTWNQKARHLRWVSAQDRCSICSKPFKGPVIQELVSEFGQYLQPRQKFTSPVELDTQSQFRLGLMKELPMAEAWTVEAYRLKCGHLLCEPCLDLIRRGGTEEPGSKSTLVQPPLWNLEATRDHSQI